MLTVEEVLRRMQALAEQLAKPDPVFTDDASYSHGHERGRESAMYRLEDLIAEVKTEHETPEREVAARYWRATTGRALTRTSKDVRERLERNFVEAAIGNATFMAKIRREML